MNLLRLLSKNKPQTLSGLSEVIGKINDDVQTMITRGRFMGEKLGMGPNFVHAYVLRGPSGEFGPPGRLEELGWSHNLKTTVGMDWLHNTMGGNLPVTIGTATSTSATSFTKTAAGWTVDAFKGMRLVVPVTGLTTEPVYGNIGTNSSTVITVDQWWTAADGVGTTPGNSAGLLLPGQGPARFIGLTTNTSGPATSDTTLTSEETANGLQRALGTFAHTPGATTFTIAKTFTAGATFTNEHKAGLFTASTNAAGGILVAATNLNADATLASGDSIALTWTWTLPAAG